MADPRGLQKHAVVLPDSDYIPPPPIPYDDPESDLEFPPPPSPIPPPLSPVASVSTPATSEFESEPSNTTNQLTGRVTVTSGSDHIDVSFGDSDRELEELERELQELASEPPLSSPNDPDYHDYELHEIQTAGRPNHLDLPTQGSPRISRSADNVRSSKMASVDSSKSRGSRSVENVNQQKKAKKRNKAAKKQKQSTTTTETSETPETSDDYEPGSLEAERKRLLEKYKIVSNGPCRVDGIIDEREYMLYWWHTVVF